jgi:hypothetical protein
VRYSYDENQVGTKEPTMPTIERVRYEYDGVLGLLLVENRCSVSQL